MRETFMGVLQAQGEQYLESCALMALGRQPLTFRGLCDLAVRTTAVLQAHGVGRGSRVALTMPNGPEALAAFLAIGSSATVAPVNPASTEAELDAALADLRVDALVTHGPGGSLARNVASARQLTVFELSFDPEAPAGEFSLSVDAGAGRGLRDGGTGFAEPDEVAIVMATSGTTAKPKIVPLLHSATVAGARLTASALALSPRDRYLCIMPMHHVHSLITALGALATGGSVVVCPPFEADQFFQALDACQPTWYSAAPALQQAILARASAYPAVIERSGLRFIRSSSASLPPIVMAELEEVFRAPVIEGYGMTETCLYATNNPLPPEERKMGSVGVARGTGLAILDPDGRPVATGRTGEVALRGPNIVRAYENDEEANRAAFVDGWFRTGDQGYVDEDGYLFLTGRLQERINRGGEKISPGEVERVLLAHPEVAGAVVFAVPHPSLGEDVAAAVVLHEGGQTTALELRRYVATRVTGQKVPSQILLVDRIPAGPSGKIQRRSLAHIFADALRAEFVEPRNLVELGLAEVWQEVLGLASISVNDNFFRLGGDSIKAMQVVNRARGHLGMEVSIQDVFMAPTVAALAERLTESPMSQAEEPSSCRAVEPAGGSAAAACVARHAPPVGPSTPRTPTASPAAPGRPMEVGVFFFSAQDVATQGDKYRLFLECVRYADRHGFSAVWIPERHFHPFGGLYPNPSVLGAAVAMITERIQIRAGSVVVPFQDPLRVAEEWSVLDNLSGGRVGIACASGWHVNDFVLAPETYERRRDVMVERIATIQRLWRGEAVQRPNGAGKLTDVRVYPRPVQPALPIWVAGHSDATFIRAGEMGAHILTILWDTHPSELARRIALYRKARAQRGLDPAAGTVSLMLHTFVGSTMAEVERHVVPAYEQYLRVNLRLQDDRIVGINDAATRSDADSRFIIAHATEELFRSRGLVGTPESCLEKMKSLQQIGVDELGCLVDFGIPGPAVLEGLERLNEVRRMASASSDQPLAPTTAEVGA